MQERFERSISQLDKVFNLISRFAEKNTISLSDKNTISLAVEEIFTNMVKYNSTSTTKIILELKSTGRNIKITLTDKESKPFDPTKQQVYDLNQPVQSRPVGKLGIHLVNQMMDHVDYTFNNGETVITMEKFIGEQDV